MRNCTKCLITYKLLGKELDNCPHIWKPFVIFIATRKQTFNENYKWFSGHCFRVGEAWKTHRLGVITFRSAFMRLMGQTIRRNEKQTIGNAWEKGLGKTEWMKLAQWEWVFPEAVGCWSVWLEWKCNAVSGVSVRNDAAPGTEWSENGNHILQAHSKQLNVFYFLQQLMGGGEILRLFGQRSGAKRWSCAAIIHN